MDTPKRTNRSRKASDRKIDRVVGHGRAGVDAPDRSGLATCFGHVARAERKLAESPVTSSFLVKPAILESRELAPGSAPAWTRELAFDAAATAQLGLRIELPVSGEARARKLISRSRRVMTGKYPSWKIDRLVHWESRLESMVFRLLDVCPGVVSFAEQPFTIYYLSEGTWHSHVPDVVFLTFDGRIWILEIKSLWDQSVAEAGQRAALIAPRLKCLGLNYAIAMETAIRAGTSLSNAETLVRACRGAPTAVAESELQQLVVERSSVSQNDLVGRVIDKRRAFHTAASLVMRGDLSLNWCDANSQLLRIQPLMDNNREESVSWLQRALGVTK